MPTKRSRKPTETAIVEATEDEVQFTELEQTEPVEEVRETDQVEVEAPRMRRCPKHSVYFPSEDEMRPMEEFSLNKTTGKLMNTYCKRCNSKAHTEYSRRKRAEAAQSVERLQAIVDQKRAELAAAEEQLQYIMDLEQEAAEREAES